MGAFLPAMASSSGTRVRRGRSMNLGSSRSFWPYRTPSKITGGIDCQFITVLNAACGGRGWQANRSTTTGSTIGAPLPPCRGRGARCGTDVQAGRVVDVVLGQRLPGRELELHPHLGEAGFGGHQHTQPGVGGFVQPGPFHPQPVRSHVQEEIRRRNQRLDALPRQAVIPAVGVDVAPAILEAESRQQRANGCDAVRAVVGHALSWQVEARVGIVALLDDVHVVSESFQADDPLQRPGEISTQRIAHHVRVHDDAGHRCRDLAVRSVLASPLTPGATGRRRARHERERMSAATGNGRRGGCCRVIRSRGGDSS